MVDQRVQVIEPFRDDYSQVHEFRALEDIVLTKIRTRNTPNTWIGFYIGDPTYRYPYGDLKFSTWVNHLRHIQFRFEVRRRNQFTIVLAFKPSQVRDLDDEEFFQQFPSEVIPVID